MIKNIVFDVGMVLIDFCYRDYMKNTLGFDQELIDYLADNMVESDDWNQFDEGMSLADFTEFNVKKLPGYEKEIRYFFKDMTNIVRSFDYTRDMILSLKERGFKIYILSNYPNEVWDLHSKTQFTFADIVDGMVVSGKINLLKPNKEIYLHLFDKYNLKPEECVFLDDREKNIIAAREQGMHGIIFKGDEEGMKELEEIIKSYI